MDEREFINRARAGAFRSRARFTTRPRPIDPASPTTSVAGQVAPTIRREDLRPLPTQQEQRRAYDATRAPQPRGEAYQAPRNQFAEAGEFGLELTGLPSIRRSAAAFADDRPREGFEQGALGLLGVATLGVGGRGARAPRTEPPMRAPVAEPAGALRPPSARIARPGEIEQAGGAYTSDDVRYPHEFADDPGAAAAYEIPDATNVNRGPRRPLLMPPRQLGTASDGSVMPVRPPEPFRQSMVGGSDDLTEAARPGALRPQAPDGGSQGAGAWTALRNELREHDFPVPAAMPDLPQVEVPLSELRPGQIGSLDRADARNYAALTTDAPPILVRRQGRGWHIIDGNRRAEAARLRGDQNIRVLDASRLFETQPPNAGPRQ